MSVSVGYVTFRKKNKFKVSSIVTGNTPHFYFRRFLWDSPVLGCTFMKFRRPWKFPGIFYAEIPAFGKFLLFLMVLIPNVVKFHGFEQVA